MDDEKEGNPPEAEDVLEDENVGEGEAEDAEDTSDAADGSGKDAEPGADEPDGGGSPRREPESDPRIAQALARAEEAEKRASAAETRWRERERADDQRLSEKERAEKLSKMTPEERLVYLGNEMQAKIDYSAQLANFQNADAADRNEFLSKISINPKLLAFRDEVENRLRELRNTNKQNVPRMVMLYHVLGEKAVQAVLDGKGAKSEKGAKARVAAQRVAGSASARGNANGADRQKGKSARDRLANVSF